MVITERLLELRDVTVYRMVRGIKIRMLDHLSLSINQGEHSVILGPNGSGKSSLLKLLNRQYYPSVEDGRVGNIEIFGESIWNVHDLRKKMGIVSSDLDIDFSQPRAGRLTVAETVMTGFSGGLFVDSSQVHDRGQHEACAAVLEQMGIFYLSEREVRTLSTGERRRVLIARALVHQPEALVLDEPTTGLDIAARRDFLDVISRIAGLGVTIVLVTHHVEEIIPEIRHAILLQSGSLFRAGSCDEVMSSDSLSELFGVELFLQKSCSGWYQLSLGE